MYIYIYIYIHMGYNSMVYGRFGGFHSHGGTSIAGWFIMGKSENNIDDLGVAL